MSETLNNVLVVGSGAQEHAICWKLADSPQTNIVYCTPGNVGMLNTRKVVVVKLNIRDYMTVAKWCKDHNIDFVVICLDGPLFDGTVDNLNSLGIKCFCPRKIPALIKYNRHWSKRFMKRHHIPTARYKSFKSADSAKKFIKNAPYPALVVKASGFTTDKNVVVASNKKEACQAVDEILTDAGCEERRRRIVIEEFLEGDEVSVLCFTDGDTISMMPPVKTYKHLKDNDVGPNTRGMGAYSPCSLIDSHQLTYVREQVLYPTIIGLKSEGHKFVGVLHAVVILSRFGPVILGFDCHFGDPEAQVLLPLLNSDLYTIIKSCLHGTLEETLVMWNTKICTVGVVLASEGYPGRYRKGCAISGLNEVLSKSNVLVFYGGVVYEDDGTILTWGDRVLTVCARSDKRYSAAAGATSAASKITFDGVQYRRDIARHF